MSPATKKPPLRGTLHCPDGRLLPFEVHRANPHSLAVIFASEDAPAPGVHFDRAVLNPPSDPIELRAGRVEADPDPARRRLVFPEQLYDFTKLLRGGTLLNIRDRFRQLPLLLGYKESVHAEFARYVADLSYDLRVYKMLLDEVDAGLAQESPDTQAATREIIQRTEGKGLLLYLDQCIEQLGGQVASFSKIEHERHGFYLRRQLWDLLLASPFLARTNLRPRGYAGDSVMMQQIYRNQFEGASLFGQILHKHAIESKAAQAVRNRRAMVSRALREARESMEIADGAPLKFLSVACGPAWELRDLYATADDVPRFEATLLDQDREALSEARSGLAAVEARLGRPVGARIIRDSVRTMLRTTNLDSAWGQFHVIYSMGLFDYLNARVARVVLTKLYSLLEPGGRLLIGNFHPLNHTRHYMAYFMDWMLVYRTEQEFLSLTELCAGARCSIRFEETRSQMFLTVEKPA